MYEIKPILPKFDITIPTCMYQVKSLIKVDGYQHQNQNGVEVSDYIIGNFGKQIQLCIKVIFQKEIIKMKNKSI